MVTMFENVEVVKEAVTLFFKLIETVLTPVLAGAGAFIAAKIFSKREVASVKRALGYALEEIEYQKAIVTEHTNNNKVMYGQSFDRTARQNVNNFQNKFSTYRFSPSKIEFMRKRFKLNQSNSLISENKKAA